MFSKNEIYQKSLEIFSRGIEWRKFDGKSFLIVGAGGLIGTFIVDLIMFINRTKSLNISVVACGRNKLKLKDRSFEYLNCKYFCIFECDINQPFKYGKDVDYILDLASNTHPLSYSRYPVETLVTNVEGTYNLLTFAREHLKGRFIFTSSVEIYGQSLNYRPFSENDCGYINCNTVRACYNEGKRAGESLCQAFIKQYGLDIVISRLCRVYGPTMKMDDSKALSQFLKKALKGEDIVLKSKGDQLFSYLYVGDVANALLYLMLHGKGGEAYNVADSKSNIQLKDLARLISIWADKDVVFDLPDITEAAGYSKADYAILDQTKINTLGWSAKYAIKQGVYETLNVLNTLK